MRSFVLLCALTLLMAACGDSTATTPAPPPAPGATATTTPPDTDPPPTAPTTVTTTVPTTTSTSTTTTTTSTTSTTTNTTTTTAPLPEWTVAALGRNPGRSLGDSPALGSGCAPGGGDLPDGVWFGWATSFGAAGVDFDLACLWPGYAWPAAGNDSSRLRTVPVADGALTYLGTAAPGRYDATALAAADLAVANAPGLPNHYPFWLFVNGGKVTELSQYPEPIVWRLDAGGWPDLAPGCCDDGTVAPPSPGGSWPGSGWPADGFYEVWMTSQSPAASDVVIHRWVSCRDNPGLCPEWWTGDEVTIDPADPGLDRTLAHDANLTVVILPIFGKDPVVGDGAALRALLAARDADVAYWLDDPDTALPWAELEARAGDPDFAFGLAFWPGTTEGLVGYRGPGGTIITWDYWWLALEIRDGAPILYAHAGLVAG